METNIFYLALVQAPFLIEDLGDFWVLRSSNRSASKLLSYWSEGYLELSQTSK